MTTLELPAGPPAWRLYLIRATVFLMPLSVNLERLSGPLKRPWYLSPFDLLLPLLVVLLVVDLLQRRAWVRFKCPPLPTLLWAALALVSCLWIADFPHGATWGDWVRGAANPLLVVLLPVWVFLNVSRDPAEYRRLALLLGASFLLCVAWAVVQFAGPQGLPFDPATPTQDLHGASNLRVAGWYDFRALFGAQVALLVPAAAAFALLDPNRLVRMAAGALCVAALCVTLASGGLLAACAGVVAVVAACAVQRGYWIRALLALAVATVVLGIILPHLPRRNPTAVLRGLSAYADVQDKKKPTAHLRRYQAALDLLAAPSDPRNAASTPNWVRGVGAGRYQERIGEFYQPPYDKPSARTDAEAQADMETHERFTFSLIETIAVELGLPGLLVVLFFFGVWCVAALSAFSLNAVRPMQDVLALAAWGAGCGAGVLSVFGNPVLRGAGPGGTFAFFFALALVCWRWREEAGT